MSNRQRLNRAQRSALVRAARCPDCASEVAVNRHGVAEVRHDDTCPDLAARTRTGRLVQVAIVLSEQFNIN
jgi:hypothetical protein